MLIPEHLAESCRESPELSAWLERLPDTIGELQRRWRLAVGSPFQGEDVSAAWVAPVRHADGTHAILKLGMPHMEAEHELDGLRFWNGDLTVRVLDADDALGAMLLERCVPGTTLRSFPEREQDIIIAGLLRRMWRTPPAPHPFRPLSSMTEAWVKETSVNQAHWPDPGLVREGVRLFEVLPRNGGAAPVLLATDMHAGNVLSAQRERWLIIDPKPFMGDPAYDATQHLLNCEVRLRRDPLGTIARFADLLDVDPERVRMWLFARITAEVRDDWKNWMDLARRLAD